MHEKSTAKPSLSAAVLSIDTAVDGQTNPHPFSHTPPTAERLLFPVTFFGGNTTS